MLVIKGLLLLLSWINKNEESFMKINLMQILITLAIAVLLEMKSFYSNNTLNA